MRIFSGFFIGIVFLVIGIVLLLNSIFNFNAQMFKLIIGIVVVLFGIFILFNGFGLQDTTNIIFKEGTIRVKQVREEYNIIFASGVIDLSKIDLENEIKSIKINTIFAEGSVILSSEIPASIHASSAFGELELGNSSTGIFGSKKYKIGEMDVNRGYLDIEANSVFGRLKFIITN
ncbi:MAG: DUF373 family protein [Candidatus Caldatribacteriota bacterium]|nr:DUF373 family protein [Candidatus Caldatribacteriota bacterium]